MDPKTWPASKVKQMKVADLKEAAQNSRVHSDDQIEQIAKSIQEFGWTIPVLVDEDGTLIAGHARVRAALKLGIDKVPGMIASGWSDARKEAYQIADNKLAENSSWDDEILAAQIKRLSAAEFNLGSLGFDPSELNLGGAFNPNLAPTVGKTTVTASDVDKAKNKLDTQFDANDKGKAETYEVVCPHCGETMEVQL